MRTPSGTVVVIEDDPHIADLVGLYLQRDGFRVLEAADGSTGLALIERERPVIVVLDIGLPGELDGFDVCRRLVGAGGDGRPSVPVLVLSARDDEVDRVLGLELGADDYVTKPFSPRELVARVRAILRRSAAGRDAPHPPVLEVGAVAVDTARREVHVAGRPVVLTAREFDLLAHLAANVGLALSRRQLLDAVWGAGWIGDERTVDVHVRQLRKKVGAELPLATVWGVGYRLG
ncbi:MAG: response regulator transcription factor [Actinomycetota bacterium]|jgi:DNA-binding response OmpR family regulator|nr:response regulator transcription factor [Actinomycetota bacterium]MDA8294762.1 response regulator transcription factor [Actinomycetota bacterium]